jgi:enoyl-CoA hydratase/carnithine racemase
MAFITISDNSEIRILALSRGKANAMNLALVDELLAAVHIAAADDTVEAVVVASDRPGFFSAGFDVEEVFAYDRPAMSHFFGRFMDLFEALVQMPKPVVGAISGHAWAGGAFLALGMDARIFGNGDFSFALNEINFGAVLPAGIRRALIAVVGGREATRIILTGESVSPAHAMRFNLADAVVPANEVLPRALQVARLLAEKPKSAFTYTKRALQSDLGYPREREDLTEFLDQWFSPECVARREALTVALKAKSSKKQAG